MAEMLYLDYQASTPIDPRVRDAMLPWLNAAAAGNPHGDHGAGQGARHALEAARVKIATVLNARSDEIIFTSGATEANNLAVLGAARFAEEQETTKRHVITCATEHKSVLEPCHMLARQGWDITVLPVDGQGLIDPAAVNNALRPDTLLVSVMVANNETGVLQPIHEIAALCRARGVYFHSDAAQAFGKMPLDLAQLDIDMLSISGHKIYAPAGIGALYLRRKPRARIAPLYAGGGQERGLRPGTLPTALAVALGEAAQIGAEEMERDGTHCQHLRRAFLEELERSGISYQVNGSATQRLANNLNLCFERVDAAQLRAALPEIACSNGSSCNAGGTSHVLEAMGIDIAGLRLGFGRFTSLDDMQKAAKHIGYAVRKLQAAN